MLFRTAVWLIVGAFFGAMVGQMFDDKSRPGLPTLLGAAIGAVVSGLALMQLTRCDPFRRFHEN